MTPKTRTHNLHSEVLLGLSLGTNITDSIRRHGIANDSKRVLLVRIGGLDPAEAVWEGMKGLVDGTSVGLEELDDGAGVDWSRVDKVSLVALCVQKLIVVVQGCRDESAQRPGINSEKDSSYRNCRRHQVRHIASSSRHLASFS
jgi:hypothetical protein